MNNYDWKWYLSDIKQDKDISVFSCFSCGGGSSMGYKRAGFKVLGNLEIDKSIASIYRQNLHPQYSYNLDIRDFNKIDDKDLPEELFHLDILDGSPPCSTFSIAGIREQAWGKKKKFREGQKEQTLDDLFFHFLDTVEKLKPRIVVAENVVGIIQGRARGYVSEIIERFHSLGYEVQIFRLNSAYMDVPQARERVFFIANRCGFEKLVLSFNNTLIRYGEVKAPNGRPFSTSKMNRERLQRIRPGDLNIADITKREEGREIGFTAFILWEDRVAPTITAGGSFYRASDKLKVTDAEFVSIQTFPQDYDFGGLNTQYICGMSVPPNMMANIATEIWKQWLAK